MKTVDILGISYEIEENGYDPTIEEGIIDRVTLLKRSKRENRAGMYQDKLYQQIPKNLAVILTEALRKEFDNLIDIEITGHGDLRLVIELPYELQWSSGMREVAEKGLEVKELLKTWESSLKKCEKVNGKGGEILQTYHPAICMMVRKLF